MDPFLYLVCGKGLGFCVCTTMCPRPPNLSFLLDSSPCPQHPLDAASEGESLATGLASTSQDGEGLPPSRPALCPELKGDERSIVSQPKRQPSGFPGATLWEAPSSDPILPLGPQPGLGGQPLVHKRRFVAPIIRSPGRAAGQLDLRCRNPSQPPAPPGPTAVPGPGPQPREAWSQGMGRKKGGREGPS